jgi:hypothetical protein
MNTGRYYFLYHPVLHAEKSMAMIYSIKAKGRNLVPFHLKQPIQHFKASTSVCEISNKNDAKTIPKMA